MTRNPQSDPPVFFDGKSNSADGERTENYIYGCGRAFCDGVMPLIKVFCLVLDLDLSGNPRELIIKQLS